MIFTDAAYWLVLSGAIASFHRLTFRPWIWAVLCWGALFCGNWGCPLVLGLFAYETGFSRRYRKFSPWCVVGILQAILGLAYFKCRSFLLSIASAFVSRAAVP